VLDLLGRGVDLLLALLAASAQAQHQVERRLLLDVVVGERAAVLELLAGEDQALLVRGNALLVWGLLVDVVGKSDERRTLDLRLDIVDGVGTFNLEGDLESFISCCRWRMVWSGSQSCP